MAPELKQYQVDGVEWLDDRPRALLADEAGLGKSVQLLQSAVEPVLIVAPAMILNAGTWDDEIEKWTPGIEATQVSYTSIAKRGERGRVPRDSNGFPLTPLKEEYRRKWGSVILDECHHIKGRKTSWSNALLKIDSEQVHLATGTPIPNWANEAFMPLRMMWPDESKAGRRYGSYWRWAKEWFDVDVNFHGGREVGDLRDDRTWEEFREANWGDRMLRRLRDDVLDELPPLTMQEWRTPMTTEQGRAYRDLRRDYVAWLESGLEIEVWSEPGMLVKLAQIATGLETVGGKGSGKLKALEEILTGRSRPSFVVAHFRSSVEACAQLAHRMGKSAAIVHGGISMAKRRDIIRAFQRGELEVLCASIGTVAEGMTLHQGGADLVVRVERAWTPSKNDQVIRRLHRQGLERPVHCIDLITPNSIDERVVRLLDQKSDQQMKALGRQDILALV